jgi:hypothetical protein
MDLYKLFLAKAKVMLNDKDIDLAALYAYKAENRLKTLEGNMARIIGQILLNNDAHHISEAQEWIEKGI